MGAMKNLLILCLAMVATAALADDCCSAKKPSPDEEFMKIAKQMEISAEGKKACCKSTIEKPMAKGEKGCCNAPSEPKPFKVYVAGQGYKFFGCKDSAAQGRKELMASGVKVGQVQKSQKA
jgi:hypothetical protein